MHRAPAASLHTSRAATASSRVLLLLRGALGLPHLAFGHSCWRQPAVQFHGCSHWDGGVVIQLAMPAAPYARATRPGRSGEPERRHAAIRGERAPPQVLYRVIASSLGPPSGVAHAARMLKSSIPRGGPLATGTYAWGTLAA